MTARSLVPAVLLLATACTAQSAAAPTVANQPQPPGPGPLQAEAEEATRTIKDVARACAAGRLAEVRARVEPSAKVSRPAAPDLGEPELPVEVARLCAGSGAASVAELEPIVEEISVQPNAALATVTMNGTMRGAPANGQFTVRGMVYLLRGPTGWRIVRVAYWPHVLPPVS